MEKMINQVLEPQKQEGIHVIQVKWVCRRCYLPVDVRASVTQTRCELWWLDTLCPDCKIAVKAEQEAKGKAEQVERERIAKLSRRAMIINTWGPPERFKGASLTQGLKPYQKLAANELLKICQPPDDDCELVSTGCLLIGTVGVGKTYLAAGLFNSLMDSIWFEDGIRPAWFISEYDLLSRIRATFKDGAKDTEYQILKLAKDVHPCLILDDVAKYTPQDSSFRNRILFEIIDYRWSRKLATVITANHNLSQLSDLLGDPIVDRIRDFGQVIELKGPSQRGQH